MPDRQTAAEFVARLRRLRSVADVERVARFYRVDPDASVPDNEVAGVAHGKVFALAKELTGLSLDEIERLLESPYYEARLGAVSVMDFRARARSAKEDERKALYDLYLRRHDRIDNWDLVDRAAPHVVGGYLRDKPRDVLVTLARSANPCERRTAIVSTYFFLRSGDVGDTFRIAELLVHDEHDLVQKATGSWVREAGKKDRARLLAFLDAYSATMPRTMLRYAVEQLEPAERARYMASPRGRA
jgi:3-methyladenine DNA glycosylase AlkD